MARKDLTWEPTADGQAVLYGVTGPSYNPDKFAKGYSMLFDAQREEIATVYDTNCQVREQRVDQNTQWPVRYFPKEARGQWLVDNGEVVLMYGGKEIARGIDESGRAKLPDRLQTFNAANAIAEAAA